MVDERELDKLLAEMATDEAPLPAALRTAILDDAMEAAAPAPARGGFRLLDWLAGWGGAMGVPVAALAGLWIGFAQPALVLNAVPGTDYSVETDSGDILLADVFGGSWEEIEQ